MLVEELPVEEGSMLRSDQAPCSFAFLDATCRCWSKGPDSTRQLPGPAHCTGPTPSQAGSIITAVLTLGLVQSSSEAPEFALISSRPNGTTDGGAP